MGNRLHKICYIAGSIVLGLLALFFVCVCITSLCQNAIAMTSWTGLFAWRIPGNYCGLFLGFVAYLLFTFTLRVLRMGHNLDWMMKFSHELTHTLVAIAFLRKIHEFVVKGRDCHVRYKQRLIGYLATNLAPYCIPIYTIMLFPFRFTGDSEYMIVFDFLIAFTYAFHIEAFIRQTRFSQSDIRNCGRVLSVAYISFVHFAVLSLILAIPRGGVLNAICRVFCEYPLQIITNPLGWVHEIIQYF